MSISDSYDVCMFAVILIKKLMGSEETHLGNSQFAREMLQIISDVSEPIAQQND